MAKMTAARTRAVVTTAAKPALRAPARVATKVATKVAAKVPTKVAATKVAATKVAATKVAATKVAATKVAATKVAATKVPAKAASRVASRVESKVVTKGASKVPAKVVSKPLPKAARKAPVGEIRIDQIHKPKLVRDSFTMPEQEYAVLAQVKKACIKAGFEIKKSELLRVGVALLSQLDTVRLKKVLASLPQLKTGRPRKESS